MLRYLLSTLKSLVMARKPPKDPLIVVLGATGTGKSQLAVALAKRFNGEVINSDAMQMYKGLPILTNKVTTEEQNGVPHHLLEFIRLDEEPWRVGLFKKKAGQTIKEIRSRGRLPILVGGSHYYTQSLLFEESLIGGERNDQGNTSTRNSSEEVPNRFPILEGPTEAMVQELRKVDPVMAGKWHPKDRRKIRRSLEIFLLTGKKASDIYAEQKYSKAMDKSINIGDESHASLSGSTLLFWAHADSATLKERLDARVDKMVESGLLEELNSMDKFVQDQATIGVFVDQTRGIWISIGWKHFEPYIRALNSGAASAIELKRLYDKSVEQTKAATRQYARRQLRWIRRTLMAALSNENCLDKLYLLDGTDILDWTNNVSETAIGISKLFLDGDELPAPEEVCSAAKIILVPENNSFEKKGKSFQKECEICDMTIVEEDKWDAHLKSRKHRSRFRKQKRQTAVVVARPAENLPVPEDTFEQSNPASAP